MQNPLLDGNTNLFLPNEGLGQGETLSILGKLIEVKTGLTENQAQKVNFAMLVIQAIAYIGIEHFTNQLQDIGTFQDQIAQAQSAFGSIQSGFAAFEQNAYWNGKNAQFSTTLEQAYPQISSMAEAIYSLYNNQNVSGLQSGTPTWQSISLAFPQQGGGYAYIEPFQADGKQNGQSWTLVNDFIQSLNNYIFGPNSSNAISLPTSAGSNQMPIYIAMALSQVQVTIDGYSQYMVDAQGNFISSGTQNYEQMYKDGTLLNFLFGAFDTDAPLEAVQNFASLLQITYTGISPNESLLTYIENSSPSFSAQALLQPFADMMADYLENKYQGQPSGPSDPSGYIPGIVGSTSQFKGSISLFSDLNTSATQGTSELQTETQTNSANAQLDTTQINSYDQIGQTIVTGVNQAQQMMTQNQTVS